MSISVKCFVLEKYWPVAKDTICPKWQERSEQLIAYIIAGIGDYPIDAVPVEACEGWINSLRAKYKSPVTPNRALVRAKQIFATAIRWGYCSENPFKTIKKKTERERKFLFLTPEQHERLLFEAGAKLQWYIIFARYTGGRMSSLAALEERDIDLQADELTFRDTKNGEDVRIPLHPALRPWVLKSITGNPTRRLLPQYADVHSVSQLFRRLRKRLGIEGFRFHDYRHNLGSALAAHGHGTKAIMQILGHKTEKMSLRYQHVDAEYIKRALAESI